MMTKLYFLASKGVGALFLILSYRLIASAEGLENIGRFSLIVSLVTIMSSVLLLGLDTYVNKRAAFLRSNNSDASTERTSLIFIICATCAIFLLFIFVLDVSNFDIAYFNGIDTQLMLKSLYLSPCLALAYLCMEIYRPTGSEKLYAFVKHSGLYTILIILMLAVELDSKTTFFWSLFFYLVFVLFLVFTSKANFYIYSNTLIEDSKKIVKQSSYMMLTAVSASLLTNIDTLMIAKLLSPYDLGVYSSILKICALFPMILAAMTSMNMLKLSGFAQEKNYLKFRGAYQDIVISSLLFCLPVLFVLAIYPIEITELISGDLNDRLNVLYMMMVYNSLLIMFGPVLVSLNIVGLHKLGFWLIVFGVFINVLLNTVLIPKFGVIGAIFGSTVGILVWKAIGISSLYRRIKNEFY